MVPGASTGLLNIAVPAPDLVCLLDQHEFCLNQANLIKLIGCNILERGAGAKPRTLLLIPL